MYPNPKTDVDEERVLTHFQKDLLGGLRVRPTTFVLNKDKGRPVVRNKKDERNLPRKVLQYMSNRQSTYEFPY